MKVYFDRRKVSLKKIFKKRYVLLLCLLLALTACRKESKASESGETPVISGESVTKAPEGPDLPDGDDTEPAGDVPDAPTPLPTTEEPAGDTPTPAPEITETPTPVPTESPTPTPDETEVSETPTPEPTAEPTAEPTKEPEETPGATEEPEFETFEIGVYTEEHEMMIYRAIPGYTEIKLSDDEEKVEAIFAGPGPVTDFQVLELLDMSYDENGVPSYTTKIVHELKILDGEHPLGVILPPMEDIPKVAISFVDTKGVRHTYAVARGGADGIIFLAGL